MSQSNEIQNIPVVAMRGVVIFPKMVMHFMLLLNLTGKSFLLHKKMFL